MRRDGAEILENEDNIDFEDTRNIELVEFRVAQLLDALGQDIDSNEHIRQTPSRVASFLLESTANGFDGKDAESILDPIWPETYPEPTTIGGIKFSSLCPHHLIPFVGYATIGYHSNKKVVGLSKLPRLVHAHSKGLILQEKLTVDIVDSLVKILEPKGAAVHIEAEHSCMTIRGVKDRETLTTTSRFVGSMQKDPFRSEFLVIARRGGSRWER